MATLKDICDDIDWVSDRISTQVRTVCLGVLALSWALLIGDSKQAQGLAAGLKWQLLTIGGVAVIALLLDFFQYVASYWKARSLLKTLEKGRAAEGKYDPRHWLFRVQNFCFAAKQIVTIAVTFWFLFALASQIYNTY